MSQTSGRTACGGSGTSRGVSFESVVRPLWGSGVSAEGGLVKSRSAGSGSTQWRLGSQAATFPGCSSPTPILTNHNLSLRLSLQPHLPPDLSKQGKKLQTWQSAFWAVADSCQCAAGARARLACRGRSDPRGSSHRQAEQVKEVSSTQPSSLHLQEELAPMGTGDI